MEGDSKVNKKKKKSNEGQNGSSKAPKSSKTILIIATRKTSLQGLLKANKYQGTKCSIISNKV